MPKLTYVGYYQFFQKMRSLNYFQDKKSQNLFFWLVLAVVTNILVHPLEPAFGQTTPANNSTEPSMPAPIDPEPAPVPEPQPINPDTTPEPNSVPQPQPIDPSLNSEPQPVPQPQPIDPDLDINPEPDLDPQPDLNPVPQPEPVPQLDPINPSPRLPRVEPQPQ